MILFHWECFLEITEFNHHHYAQRSKPTCEPLAKRPASLFEGRREDG